MKKRSPLILLSLIVLLGGGGFAVWFYTKPAPPPEPGQTEQAIVEKKTLEDVIEVSGHLKARDEQEIRSPLAGIVTKVYVEAGQPVASGSPLVSLDSSEQEQTLNDLAFQIDQERFSGNLRKVALLEGKAAVQKRVLEDLTLKAHLDGKVSRLSLRVGDIVKAGDSYGRLIDVRSLIADVEVAEMDIPRAKVGQPVEFRFSAIPGLLVKGRVASFPAEAKVNDRGLTVLEVRLVIDAPPPELLPAYSFQATILAGPPRDVLVVDSRAIRYQAGKPTVQRKTPNGAWSEVAVETEGFGSGVVRIVSGCAEGDVLKISAPSGAPL